MVSVGTLPLHAARRGAVLCSGLHSASPNIGVCWPQVESDIARTPLLNHPRDPRREGTRHVQAPTSLCAGALYALNTQKNAVRYSLRVVFIPAPFKGDYLEYDK